MWCFLAGDEMKQHESYSLRISHSPEHWTFWKGAGNVRRLKLPDQFPTGCPVLLSEKLRCELGAPSYLVDSFLVAVLGGWENPSQRRWSSRAATASESRPEADSRPQVGQLAVRVTPGAGFEARSRWQAAVFPAMRKAWGQVNKIKGCMQRRMRRVWG